MYNISVYFIKFDGERLLLCNMRKVSEYIALKVMDVYSGVNYEVTIISCEEDDK